MTGHLWVLAWGRALTGRPAICRQATQIALERVEIDHQGRGVDLVERHADLGGRARGHGWVSLGCNSAPRLAKPARECNPSMGDPRI
jgi:hypothetical protein